MRVAVVGAGPSGIVAAHRLQQSGHDVVVFEAQPFVGGRTHAQHFGDGHHLDTGAGWFTSAYTRTLALLDEIGLRDRLHPMRASGPAELLVDGERYTGMIAPRSAGGSELIPSSEQAALMSWFGGLADHPRDLTATLDYDDEDAVEHLSRVSPAAADYVFAPMFEGLFAPIAQQSAAMVRAWVASGAATYWQVEGGTDVPFLHIASSLDVRTSTPVRRVTASEVVTDDASHAVEAVVVAVPPPVGASIVDVAPDFYGTVRYFGQVRLYVTRRASGTQPVHVRPLPMGLVTSVESQDGADGAWGACPSGTQWVLVCANGAYNDELLPLDDAAIASRLWTEAGRHTELFGLDRADLVHVVRWRHAVPTMAPGHFTRMAHYERRAPVILAGDWTHQACVEGAVRSGEAAAAAVG